LSDNYQSKKIDIQPYNVKEIVKLNENVQPFVNKLLERYFAHDVVFLSEENKQELILKSKDSGMSIDEIVNKLLETVDIGLPEKKVVKVELFSVKVKTSKNEKRDKRNFVTDI